MKQWGSNIRNVDSIKDFLKKKLGSYPRIKMILGLGFYEPFQYTINSLNFQEEFHSNLPAEQIQRLNHKDLQTKKSETLFILGGGPSISSLTEKNFKAIADSDSMGFNHWMQHRFVPNYYLLQIDEDAESREEMIRAIKEKRQEYQSCNVYLRGDHNRLWPEIVNEILDLGFGRRPMKHLPEFPISPESSISVESQIKFLDNLGILNSGEISRYVPKPAGTVGLCICLGLQLGYENIVLLGVDMNDQNYFFDRTGHRGVRARIRSWLLPKKGTFLDKGFGSSHREWIIGLAKYFESKKGVKVWLGTDGSSLSGELDDWQW